MIFDVTGDKLTEYLQGKVGVDEYEIELRDHHAISLALWRRFRGEVTSLGFLSFTAYIFSQAGFYEWLEVATESIQLPELPDEGEEGEAASEGRLLSGVGSTGANGCHMFLTDELEWLVEQVERVHMSLFISMCFYFLVVCLALSMHTCSFGPRSAKRTQSRTDQARARHLLGQARLWPRVVHPSLCGSKRGLARMVYSPILYIPSRSPVPRSSPTVGRRLWYRATYLVRRSSTSQTVPPLPPSTATTSSSRAARRSYSSLSSRGRAGRSRCCTWPQLPTASSRRLNPSQNPKPIPNPSTN